MNLAVPDVCYSNDSIPKAVEFSLSCAIPVPDK